jgi:hypothetical protein
VVAGLPTADRDLLFRRYVCDETFSVMAERLGIGASGARMRHHRLLRKMREAFLARVGNLPSDVRVDVLRLVGEEPEDR